MHENDIMGDYIGTESCVDLIKGGSGGGGGGGGGSGGGKRSDQRKEVIKKGNKEYPPPIKCLARTENGPSSHMPWIMKRYYTSDGRLIIREEKAPSSDFLRVNRSNGRLTLQLVPMSQDDDEDEDGGDGDCKGDEEKENVEDGSGDDDRETVVGGGKTVVNGGGIKCYNYETVRSSSCLYVMQVPAM